MSTQRIAFVATPVTQQIKRFVSAYLRPSFYMLTTGINVSLPSDFIIRYNLRFMKYAFALFCICSLSFIACDKGGTDDKDDKTPPLTDTTTVLGYGILNDFIGIWNGPVTSTTPLGGYPEWILDFRPIAEAHLSGKAELDTVNDIFMGFFITKFEQKYVMAFRNGGGFAGLQRVSYAQCDSSYELGGERYYRFSDFKAGPNRVYAEFRFRNDSVYMQTFTNKYNNLSAPTLHMQWAAKRTDTTAVQVAKQHFGFPKKKLMKDLSTSFDSLTEAVFYDINNDPYRQMDHPYLGQTSVTCTFGSAVQPQAGAQVILIITTQPLFSGFNYVPANLKYRSRYVLLTGANANNYAFDYMHPGDYYLNAIYDTNADQVPQSGEFIQYPFDRPFTLLPNESINQATEIGFQIP